MKIVNVMFGQRRGGVEQAVVNYCIALRSVGHEASAIVRRGAEIIPTLLAKNIPTFEIPAPYRWNLPARYYLQKSLRGADRVILHGNRAGDLTRGLRNLPPVIAVAHSRFFDDRAHFNAVIALTEARAEILRPTLHCPVHVVPNAIEIPALAPRPAMRAEPVIGVMGRLSEEKGVDLFLDALAQLRARGIPLRAHIGGDGPIQSSLREQAERLGIADHIEWCGWVHDKTAFFESIDIFCLPSRTEGFPITLLEAMAHACPIVATDCGGPSTMLTAESGIVTAIRAEAIADGIAQLLTNPARARTMGENARARATENYSLPVVAAKLNDVMNRCA